MRITNNTLSTNYLRNLNRNLEQMQKYQDQLSSGKTVSKPSDDPLLVSKIMDLNNNILQNEQYNTNISDTLGWVRTQDGALNNVSSTLNRIRELVIYGANGSLAETDRLAIKDEVVMKIGELADTLNTNFDGRYIFAGQKTTEAPFTVVESTDADGSENYILKYNVEIDPDTGLELTDDEKIGNGAKSNITREISKGVTVDLITNGKELMTSSDITDENEDLGQLLNNIVKALDSGTSEAIEELSGDYLSNLDKHIDNVLQIRSKIGAIDNRLQAAQERNDSENLNLTALLSEREDIDVAEKYMEYSNMRAVYQASLQVGGQILQPSLLDYIS